MSVNLNRKVEKVYWKLSEVAKEAGVSSTKVNYLVGFFKLRIKAKNGHRRFKKFHVKYITRIVGLSLFFNLQAIKDFKLYKDRQHALISTALRIYLGLRD